MWRMVCVCIGLLLVGCADSGPRRASQSQPAHRAAPAVAVKPPRATNPYEALRWRRLTWLDENGQIPEFALQRALAQREENIAYWANRRGTPRGLDASSWVEQGPDNVGGRTRSILVDPADPNRLLGGSVSGGIWRSVDGGATWVPVNDALPNLAIACLARDPSNPSVLYAGTGEGFFNGDAVGGTGIYKSTDGGDTWTLLPGTAGWDNVCRIAVCPTNSNIVLASKRYGGIMRSANGGVSWTNPRWAQGSFYVAFDPTDGNKAVAHIIDYDWGVNNWFHAALYSTNTGANWTSAGGLNQVWDFGSRIELAYAPSSPNIVYASVAINGGVVYGSTDGGHSYALRTTSGTSSVSWYANPLWVDPTDLNFLITGGYNILKSVDGGVTLTQISDGYIMTLQPHVDIHTFTNDPGFASGTPRLYVGTDGGIWKTDDIYTASTTSGWSRCDQSYRTTQFYGAAGQGPSGLLYGGTQDNGTLRLITGSSQAILPFGGDGGFCAIDPNDPNYCYGEYIFLQIHRSKDRGQSAGYIYYGIADAGTNANFIAPFVLDPNNYNRMFAGGASLWRTPNVKSWTNPLWTSIRPPGTDLISAIAIAPGNSAIAWIGQNNGEVWRSANATSSPPTWTAVDDNNAVNPLPNRYVTRILIDSANSQIVYVAFGGFSGDNLWVTYDGGTTWGDATGGGATGLPSAPVRGIARHPDNANWLYAGTEVGIFASLDGGLSWSTSNNGPANVSVDELVFMHHSNMLLAATHGRGLFTATIYTPLTGDLNCDGSVDFGDINPFVLALADPAGWQAAYPNCPPENGDINLDGSVDFGDINPFVTLLTP